MVLILYTSRVLCVRLVGWGGVAVKMSWGRVYEYAAYHCLSVYHSAQLIIHYNVILSGESSLEFFFENPSRYIMNKLCSLSQVYHSAQLKWGIFLGIFFIYHEQVIRRNVSIP